MKDQITIVSVGEAGEAVRPGSVVRYRAWGGIQHGEVLTDESGGKVLVQDHHPNGAREWIPLSAILPTSEANP